MRTRAAAGRARASTLVPRAVTVYDSRNSAEDCKAVWQQRLQNVPLRPPCRINPSEPRAPPYIEGGSTALCINLHPAGMNTSC